MNESTDITPHKLQRLLTGVTLAGIIVVLTLTGLGLHYIYRNLITQNAEHMASYVGHWLAQREISNYISKSDDQESLLIHPDDYNTLTRALTPSLETFHIFKIKIFNLEKIIIYSTDKHIIGKLDARNSQLQKAMGGTVGSVFEKKNTVQDLKGETRFTVDVVETYVPIRSKSGNIVGVFEIYQDTTQIYHQLNKSILLSMGVMLVTMLVVFGLIFLIVRVTFNQLATYQDRLTTLAARDYLTGLLNHREIMQQANAEFSLHKREKDKGRAKPLSVIMIDLDNFKAINDKYGHPAGDMVLKQTAKVMSNSVREHNHLARYGGEEFIVLLPDTDIQAAEIVASRICKNIAQLDVRADTESISVTASIGISITLEDDTDMSTVIRRADEALYQAKANGKNRVQTKI